jgi:hypothetical protein
MAVTDTKRVRYGLRYTGSARASDDRGIAALELALILPILLVLAFAVIDLGRFIQARLVIANVSREGGSLASRMDVMSNYTDLLTMLMSASSGLNMAADGKIYIWKIRAGVTASNPNPFIDLTVSTNRGGLSVASSIGTLKPNLGLSNTLYGHLVFKPAPQATADIGEVTVVEVFYKYTPITPISKFIPGLLTGGREIIASKAVF